MTKNRQKAEIRHQVAVDVAHLLSGELTERQAQDMAGWSSESPELQSEFLATTHLLADMEQLSDSPAIQAVLDEDDGQPVENPRRLWPRVSMAATILLGCSIGYMLLTEQFSGLGGEADVQRYVTRTGEQKEVQLPDGSLVNMNTASEIMVDYREDERRVTFVKGEAYFDVVKSPEKPFSVAIGSRVISVLGTSFNIRKMPDSFILGVTEGAVALHKSGQQLDSEAPIPGGESDDPLPISPSQQHRFTAGWVASFNSEKNSLVAYIAEDLESSYSWRSGIVSFSGEPFHKVIQELNRYSAKKILIVDSQIMDLSVYAGIRIGNIDAALSSLEKAYPIKVSHDFDQILISGPGSAK